MTHLFGSWYCPSCHSGYIFRWGICPVLSWRFPVLLGSCSGSRQVHGKNVMIFLLGPHNKSWLLPAILDSSCINARFIKPAEEWSISIIHLRLGRKHVLRVGLKLGAVWVTIVTIFLDICVIGWGVYAHCGMPLWTMLVVGGVWKEINLFISDVNVVKEDFSKACLQPRQLITLFWVIYILDRGLTPFQQMLGWSQCF